MVGGTYLNKEQRLNKNKDWRNVSEQEQRSFTSAAMIILPWFSDPAVRRRGPSRPVASMRLVSVPDGMVVAAVVGMANVLLTSVNHLKGKRFIY